VSKLNRRRVATATKGSNWHAQTVLRLMTRLENVARRK
jgi:hypothetical protein